MEPEEGDFLQRFISSSSESEVVTCRFSGFQSTDIYFNSNKMMLILLKGNMLASMYYLKE